MIFYEEEIKKAIKKKVISKEVFKRFHNIFTALEVTWDFSLFDIRRLKTSNNRIYYRVRKGKYRAIFYIENKDIYVIKIAKREEVYRKWE